MENSRLQKEAVELLAKASNTSYVRLVIGDRPAKPGTKKDYESQISSSSIFELNAAENVDLLDAIFKTMPAWKAKASEEQIKNTAHATLFQLLFIFQYAKDQRGDIADVYKRIFASDCRALLERSTAFWQGMASALFFYANLYIREGVVVSIEFLCDLAAYFGNCDIPGRYSTSIDELMNDRILKKYFGLDSISVKYTGVVNRFRFHHDTMADSGWMLLGDLVGEQYNETALQAVSESFKDKHPWIVGFLYYRQLRFPGNKGMEAARSYLNISHPERNYSAFISCLKRLRNEPLAKDKAREFLETEKPWENHSSFTVCLDLLKAEGIAKDKAREFLETEKPWVIQVSFTVCLDLLKDEGLAKDKAREFLKTEKPWVIQVSFTVCLNLLKDEGLAKDKAREFLETEKPWAIQESFTVCLNLLKDEGLAKDKAREFLETKKPWENIESFNVCLDLLKDEEAGIDKAVFILKNRYDYNADHHWRLLYRSLNVAYDKPGHEQLVTLVASEVIASRHRMGYQYEQLLKIPLFYVPQWMQSTESCIRNWSKLNHKNPGKPLINRNALYSITISYTEKPELIEAMCLGLIRNWQFELRIKQKHQAYFIRCLAHPAIQQDDKLRQEMIAICKEILHCVTQPPLIINKGTKFWLKNIFEHNQFPEWSYE